VKTRLAIGTLLALFALTAGLVVAGITLPCDEAILRAAGNARSDSLTAVMRVITTLGSGNVEVPLALGLVALLWKLGAPGRARRYLYAGLSGELVYIIAKASFGRPRPQIISHLSGAGWTSFPSGHSMLAPIIYTFGFVLLARTITSRPGRLVLLGIGAIMPLAVAISRVYLGVHYPSDVVAALLLGSAWALCWDGEGSRASTSATSSAPATR
jgi:undecaprenyl-diphosphatase